MRIGCLQFAPQVGDVDNNLNRADSVLSKANPEDLDVLVLPELAFSGYNFKSLQDITPFLEPSGSGITSLWARTIALKYNCIVTVGYPEKVDVSPKWPTGPEYYNSAIVVNGDGETIANYRKSFLYYTDESWALEGNHGFYEGFIPGLGNTSMGICMDINPYKFEAPWESFEFAHHVLQMESNLVIVSMAWMTREDPRRFSRMPNEPDMETLTYWVTRLEPLIRAENEDEIIVIFCNRTGSEEEVTYAGTSAVIGIQDGEVKVYGLLGRGEKELLVIDTTNPPYAKLVYRPESGGLGKTKPGELEKQIPPDTAGHGGLSEEDAVRYYKSEGGQQTSPDAKTHSDAVSQSSHHSQHSQRSQRSESSQRSKRSASSGRKSKTRTSSREPTGRGPSMTAQLLELDSQPPPPPLAPLPLFSSNDLGKPSPKKRAAPISIPPPDLTNKVNSARSPGMESFNIPTPSAPSPTPMAVRPRLIIPESPPILPHQYPPDHPISAASLRSVRSIQSVKSDESEASVSTVRSNPRPPEDSTPYPHSGVPLSGYPSNYFKSEVTIYGGEVTISQADDAFSPSTPFDDISPISPRWFWRPSDSLLRTPMTASTWTPGTPIGRRAEPFPWPALGEMQPQTRNLASDRTNNSKTPQAELRQTNSQSPQSNASSNRTSKANQVSPPQKSTNSKGTVTTTQKSERPARPSSPKSRNASRNGMHERSNSSLSERNVASRISQHLEGISQRAESVNRMRRESVGGTPFQERSGSRNGSRPRADGVASRQTIQIGASPSLLESGKSAMFGQDGRSSYRPPSRSAQSRADSFTYTNGGYVPGSGANMPRPASRAASRGRAPGPKVAPTNGMPEEVMLPMKRSSSTDSTRNELLHARIDRRQQQGTLSQNERRPSRGSRQNEQRSSSEEKAVDFERVEAVVCPSCPVHGQSPSHEHSRHGEIPISVSQSPPQRSGSGELSHSKSPRINGQAQESLPSDTLAQRASNELAEASDCSSSADTFQTISTPGRSPTTPSLFEPSTPKAMVFAPDDTFVEPFPDGSLDAIKKTPTTRCAEDDAVMTKAESSSTLTA